MISYEIERSMILVYFQLLKLGFRIIDGLDPSIGMLDKAKEKNVYRTYICDFLTTTTMQDANGN